jgi:hypothetical protein
MPRHADAVDIELVMQGCREMGSKTWIFFRCAATQLTEVEVHAARLDYFLTAHVFSMPTVRHLDYALISVHSISTEKPTSAVDS